METLRCHFVWWGEETKAMLTNSAEKQTLSDRLHWRKIFYYTLLRLTALHISFRVMHKVSAFVLDRKSAEYSIILWRAGIDCDIQKMLEHGVLVLSALWVWMQIYVRELIFLKQFSDRTVVIIERCSLTLNLRWPSINSIQRDAFNVSCEIRKNLQWCNNYEGLAQRRQIICWTNPFLYLKVMKLYWWRVSQLL